MKKLMALLLAVVMLLGLTACGTAEPAQTTAATTEAVVVETEVPTEVPTEAPTEVPTEAPTEPVVPAEELLRSEDTVTVKYSSFVDYFNKLWELGYDVIKGDYLGEYEGIEFHSLTYNDRAFRLEFTYLVGVNGPEEGWVLYGVHDQDGLANISDVNFDDYKCVDAFEDSRIPERAAKALAQNPVPLVAETTICSDNYVDPVWTSHTSLYFPKTRNLYNYVRVPEEGTEGSLNYPAGELLFGWQEVLEYEWDERGLPIIWIFYHFDNKADRFGVDIIYTDEKMSWREWCESEFNINGWTYVDEGDGWVVPPFFDYVIQDAGEDVPLDADKVGFHPGLRLNGEKCMLYYIDILSLSEARELGYPG